MTTAELLGTAGRALYGLRFAEHLATDLGVNYRTVQRWAAGTIAVPPNILGEIAHLIYQRQEHLTRVRVELLLACAPIPAPPPPPQSDTPFKIG